MPTSRNLINNVVLRPFGKTDQPKIMIVGDVASNDDLLKQRMYSDMIGVEFKKMLHEAGIPVTECYVTLLCKHKIYRNDLDKLVYEKKTKIPEGYVPHQDKHVDPSFIKMIGQLQDEIKQVQPTLIIAVGRLPFWVLFGEDSIFKWRGSELRIQDSMDTTDLPIAPKLIPIYDPKTINRQWKWRSPTIVDLRRAAREAQSLEYHPDGMELIIRPSFDQAVKTLEWLIEQCENAVRRPHTPAPTQYRVMGYAPYLEPNAPHNGTVERTRRFPLAADIETIAGHIACVGIAWSHYQAIVIPIMCKDSLEGYWTLEEEVIISQLLETLLTHPGAGVVGQNWHYDSFIFAWERSFVPHHLDDTMTMQHVLYAGSQKSLDYISSIYCRKHIYWKDELDDYKKYPEDETTFWIYNGKDCLKTYEGWWVLRQLIEHSNMEEVYIFQMQLFDPLLAMMLQGIDQDRKAKEKLRIDLMNEIYNVEQEIFYLVDEELNLSSPQQLSRLFYKTFGVKPVFNRKSKNFTVDDNALKVIASRQPLLAPVTDLVSVYRTLNIFLNTFVNAPEDTDGKLRTTFKVNGTETFRFASSKNALHRGTNFQNVPTGDEAGDGGHVYPNIRRMFIPGIGYVLMDWDLEKADAQVVAWEADDDELKQIFREGLNLHAENAKSIFGVNNKHTYAMAKRGVHATNYLASVPALAAALGITRHEADRFQTNWFKAHPRILNWHDRLRDQLMTTRTVHNAFGYRRIYFDRIQDILKEAVAWIPQSTVACVINRALYNLYKNMPNDVDLLVQVHDSLVMRTPKQTYKSLIPKIQKEMEIIVPYPDPLVIAVNCKVGVNSWGELD